MSNPPRRFVMGANRPNGIGKTVASAGPSSSNFYSSEWYQKGSIGSVNPSGSAVVSGSEAFRRFDPLSTIRSTMRSFTPQNSVINSIGINTNWYVPYARKAGQFAQSTFEDYVTGQVIFTNKDKHKALQRRTTQRDVALDWVGGYNNFNRNVSEHGYREEEDATYARTKPLGERYSMFTLQRLNWSFALTEQKPTNVDDYIMDAETRMSTWSLDGVVRNEEGGEDHTGAQDYLDAANEKVLNITIQGQAYIFNLWGNKIEPQTKLWFIVKRVPREKLPEKYIVNGKGEGHWAKINKTQAKTIFESRNINKFDSEDDDLDDDDSSILTKNPFQVIPWASAKYDRPPPSELEYVDDFGEISYGKAIYLGRVQYTPRYVNDHRFDKVWHNTVAAINSPKLWIFVDPKSNS
jgi:hypothetical protein